LTAGMSAKLEERSGKKRSSKEGKTKDRTQNKTNLNHKIIKLRMCVEKVGDSKVFEKGGKGGKNPVSAKGPKRKTPTTQENRHRKCRDTPAVSFSNRKDRHGKKHTENLSKGEGTKGPTRKVGVEELYRKT